jgi:hypothetical protein
LQIIFGGYVVRNAMFAHHDNNLRRLLIEAHRGLCGGPPDGGDDLVAYE